MRTITKRIEDLGDVEVGDKVTASVRRRPGFGAVEQEMVVSGTAWRIGSGPALTISGLVTLRHSDGTRSPDVLHWSATREVAAPPESGWLTNVVTRTGMHMAYAYRDNPDQAWVAFDSPTVLLDKVGRFCNDADLASWTVAQIVPIEED